jgi:hypothetical protein
VGLSADTIVVGTPHDDHTGGNGAGSAYVFVRSGEAWTEQAKLIASDPDARDYFGHSVAISGNTVVIGAPYEGETGAGSAYVFVRSDALWTQQAKLPAPNPAVFDLFGGSVAVSADTVVIGADGEWQREGSAYVFIRSGGLWTQQARLMASDGAAEDLFGAQLATNGDITVVTALDDSHAGGTLAGSAYVFLRSGESWTEQAKLTASDAAAYDNFGFPVSFSGNTAVFGARADDHSGVTDAGSAYVFDLNCPVRGDCDTDYHVDLDDFKVLCGCLAGPAGAPPQNCSCADVHADGNVDLADFAALQNAFAP